MVPGRRVELNAMTSDVFVRFVEDGLSAHGVTKVVPATATLAETYAAVRRGAMARRALESELARLNGAIIETPADLEQRVRDHLAAHPEETGTPPSGPSAKLTRPHDRDRHARHHRRRGARLRPLRAAFRL